MGGGGSGEQLRLTDEVLHCPEVLYFSKYDSTEYLQTLQSVAWIIAAAGTRGPTTAGSRFSVSSPSDWAIRHGAPGSIHPPTRFLIHQPVVGRVAVVVAAAAAVAVAVAVALTETVSGLRPSFRLY